MSKALTLALALAAGRAQADAGGGLVVSALFGTEPPSYVHAAVANVLCRGRLSSASVLVGSASWTPDVP